MSSDGSDYDVHLGADYPPNYATRRHQDDDDTSIDGLDPILRSTTPLLSQSPSWRKPSKEAAQFSDDRDGPSSGLPSNPSLNGSHVKPNIVDDGPSPTSTLTQCHTHDQQAKWELDDIKVDRRKRRRRVWDRYIKLQVRVLSVLEVFLKILFTSLSISATRLPFRCDDVPLSKGTSFLPPFSLLLMLSV